MYVLRLGVEWAKDKNVLSLKTMYSDTGILPTALASVKTPRAWLDSATTQGSLPAKEILTNQPEDVNMVVKGMFEKLGDKYFIRLFNGSDMTAIVHETARYLEQTFSSAERAVYDELFGV